MALLLILNSQSRNKNKEAVSYILCSKDIYIYRARETERREEIRSKKWLAK